jgi:radical SAM superfamily enzyme YgiQ (UPF0313 family)
MQKVSFVNPNFQIGPKHLNAYYLPYASGIIWNYCLTSEIVKNKYQLGEFVWRRESIADVVDRLKDNSIIGFSSYVWNRNYCYVLARELKKANPDCLIVFGGPEPPISRADIFELYPFIDIIIKNEGEVAFRRILEESDRESIPGLLINKNKTALDTGSSQRIDNLDCVPSPYLSGLFDNLISDNPTMTWNVILETTRGCPYACTFCDWGSLTYSKLKKFNLERIYAELEWFGKNGFDHVIFTDANFGILDRDSLIADKLIEVQQKYNNPKTYSVSWAKNQKREVVNIVKKLIKQGGSNIGLNLSLQTLDSNVLKIIKRDNLAMNQVEEVFNLCEQNDIPLYTELILGLPGETLETWKQNFYRLFEAGNHTGISVYQCELLENAEMNLLQKRLYDIEEVTVYDYMEGSNNTDELKESINLVRSTKSMNREQMTEAQLWSWFFNTFHIQGITNWISRFVYKKYNISYKEFYEKLFVEIENEPWILTQKEIIKFQYQSWLTEGSIKYNTGGVDIHGWNLTNSTLINLQYDKKIDQIIDFLHQFVLSMVSEESVVKELIEFQKLFLINYYELQSYPKVAKFDYDFLGYIKNNTTLDVATKYEFSYLENKELTFLQYCEHLMFSRRKNFGKSVVKKAT